MRKLTRFENVLLVAVACLATALIVVTTMCTAAAVKEDPGYEPSDAPVENFPTPEPEKDLNAEEMSLAGKRIIVDAGHGGTDHGCTGVDGRLEKEVNLEIAFRLKDALEDCGAEVIMTRTTDDAIGPTKEADMAERVRIIETSNADAFVSIHQNQYEGDNAEEMTGPQVFYAYQGTKGKKLAVDIQDMLNSKLDVENPRMALDVPYDLLIPGTQASCTVECGFFSNPEEEALLQTPEYQEKLAQTIKDGIKQYFKRTT